MATDEPNQIDEIPADVYDDYDAFLKEVIRRYYDRGWKSRKGNFIALVISSGQMASMAKDTVTDGASLKKAAIGAASVVAFPFAATTGAGSEVGDKLITEPFVFRDGCLQVPEGPGLGVTLDRTALARCHERYLAEGAFPSGEAGMPERTQGSFGALKRS